MAPRRVGGKGHAGPARIRLPCAWTGAVSQTDWHVRSRQSRVRNRSHRSEAQFAKSEDVEVVAAVRTLEGRSVAMSATLCDKLMDEPTAPVPGL